jgi:protein archease
MPCNPIKTSSTGNRSASLRESQDLSVINFCYYKEIEHTADQALECGGPDLRTFFRSAAMGMYHLMGTGDAPAKATETKTVSLKAIDLEGLLVDWLGELAYLAETTGVVFGTMEFKTLSDTCLEAVMTGSRAHRLDKIIKAVTYHDLKIKKTPEGYTTTVVFDV